jgi:hypothetical protein
MEKDGLRSILRLALVLFVGIAAGCASKQTTSDPDFAQPHPVTLDQACGNPTRFPVSQECVSMMEYPYGSLLQQKSDLLMAVWRACPSDNPCMPVLSSTPACRDLESLKPGTTEYKNAGSSCLVAQTQDYSCSRFHNDPEVKLRAEAVSNCVNKCPSAPESAFGDCFDRCFDFEYPAQVECSRAQASLAYFNDRVQKARLDAELNAAFAPPQPLVLSQPQPVIVQQSAPVMPLTSSGPRLGSAPVFTNCTNFGSTTNCITH